MFRVFRLTAAVIALGFPGHVLAQATVAYPERPILMIVPLAAGSAADASLRLIANKMSADLGKPVTVENVAGAAGIIGAERGSRAAPDGYTVIGISDSVLTSAPQMQKNARFDPLKDLAPVAQLADINWVLVAHPSFPPKTVAELVALAKGKPGSIDYSSGGLGSPQQMAMELFKSKAGINLTHVPYKGATAALTDVVAGVVPVTFTAVSIAQPFIEAGTLKALATGGAKRSALLPNVPTVGEAGVAGYEWKTWVSLMAPPNTPPEIVAKLNTAALAALKDPDVNSKLVATGFTPTGNTPEQFRANLAKDYATMTEIIKSAGITPN